MMAGGFLGGIFGGDSDPNIVANAATGKAKINNNSGKGPTNEIIKKVNGMNQRRLGGSDILVSELGLGTQRWISSDFNAPEKDEIFKFMDYAILDHGVNLIDTAEQYPIPSDGKKAQEVILSWLLVNG